MPPKSARKRQLDLNLEKAREAKRSRESGEGTSSAAEIEVRSERSGTNVEQDQPDDLAGLLAITEDAADTDDEAVDPTFDLESSMKSDVNHIIET